MALVSLNRLVSRRLRFLSVRRTGAENAGSLEPCPLFLILALAPERPQIDASP